jgi:hypothetical protein
VVTTTYEVRIAGSVPSELLAELGEETITQQETRTLVLGTFADQAELHGFLQRLRAFGLDVVEIRSVMPPPPIGHSPDVDEQSES